MCAIIRTVFVNPALPAHEQGPEISILVLTSRPSGRQCCLGSKASLCGTGQTQHPIGVVDYCQPSARLFAGVGCEDVVCDRLVHGVISFGV